MQVIRATIVPCHCYGSTSGGQEWLSQMQQSIKSCMQCLKHQGNLPKVPLCLVVTTAPLDLLHIDFSSIETTMELNQLPRVTNILVFQNHFMKHVVVYVTPNQTAKTVAKFLYQGYVSIFGALARLLTNWGSNFMSSIINKMCMLLSVKKLQTVPYCPQTNGLVERSHETIMWMIGKLGEDKKADWPGHLAEIGQAYNATQSTVMGYSPHYLMFGCRTRLPINFYFPTFRSAEAPMWGASVKHVDEYMVTVHDQLRATLWEAQAQSMAEAQWQKWYFDWKIGALDLKPGNLVLMKADAWCLMPLRERGRLKIGGKMRHVRWCIRSQQISPPMKWQTNVDSHTSSTKTNFFSCQRLAFPCVWVSGKHGTDIPAPTQLSQLPRGVKTRLCHERIVVWQSHSTRPARLPWGGSMGSYDFSHGHPLECPQRMGEDLR